MEILRGFDSEEPHWGGARDRKKGGTVGLHVYGALSGVRRKQAVKNSRAQWLPG